MELRECPFCKLKENLVIIQVKPIEYLRDDQNLEAIHCDNCDLTMHHPDKKMMYYRWNHSDTPKHETVEQTIKNVCEQYDKVNGEYVASKNPGTAIYGFYLTKYKPEDV